MERGQGGCYKASPGAVQPKGEGPVASFCSRNGPIYALYWTRVIESTCPRGPFSQDTDCCYTEVSRSGRSSNKLWLETARRRTVSVIHMHPPNKMARHFSVQQISNLKLLVEVYVQMTSDDIPWLLFKRSSVTIFLSLPATAAPSRRTNGRKPHGLDCWHARGLRRPKVELDHFLVGDSIDICFLIKTCPKSDEVQSFAYLVRWRRSIYSPAEARTSSTYRWYWQSDQRNLKALHWPASDHAHLDGGTWTGNRGPSSAGFSKSLQGNSDYFLDYIRQYLSSFGAEFLSSSLLPKNINIKVYRTVIFSVVWDGRETLSVTLREKHRLRRILGPKTDKVTGEWTKLHNDELFGLYSSVF